MGVYLRAFFEGGGSFCPVGFFLGGECGCVGVYVICFVFCMIATDADCC